MCILSFNFNLQSYKPLVTPAEVWSHLRTQCEHCRWISAQTEGMKTSVETGMIPGGYHSLTTSAKGFTSLVCLLCHLPCFWALSHDILVPSLFSVFFLLILSSSPSLPLSFNAPQLPLLEIIPSQKICLVILVGSDTGDHGRREASHPVFLVSFVPAQLE